MNYNELTPFELETLLNYFLIGVKFESEYADSVKNKMVELLPKGLVSSVSGTKLYIYLSNLLFEYSIAVKGTKEYITVSKTRNVEIKTLGKFKLSNIEYSFSLNYFKDIWDGSSKVEIGGEYGGTKTIEFSLVNAKLKKISEYFNKKDVLALYPNLEEDIISTASQKFLKRYYLTKDKYIVDMMSERIGRKLDRNLQEDNVIIFELCKEVIKENNLEIIENEISRILNP